MSRVNKNAVKCGLIWWEEQIQRSSEKTKFSALVPPFISPHFSQSLHTFSLSLQIFSSIFFLHQHYTVSEYLEVCYFHFSLVCFSVLSPPSSELSASRQILLRCNLLLSVPSSSLLLLFEFAVLFLVFLPLKLSSFSLILVLFPPFFAFPLVSHRLPFLRRTVDTLSRAIGTRTTPPPSTSNLCFSRYSPLLPIFCDCLLSSQPISLDCWRWFNSCSIVSHRNELWYLLRWKRNGRNWRRSISRKRRMQRTRRWKRSRNLKNWLFCFFFLRIWSQSLVRLFDLPFASSEGRKRRKFTKKNKQQNSEASFSPSSNCCIQESLFLLLIFVFFLLCCVVVSFMMLHFLVWFFFSYWQFAS